MGTKTTEQDDDALFYSFEKEEVFLVKTTRQKQREKQNSQSKFVRPIPIVTKNSYTYTSLSRAHHERDDEEKTGEGEKETRVFRSGRRLLERGASIFRGGLDDKNCDFDDDDDDGRAALGVVR